MLLPLEKQKEGQTKMMVMLMMRMRMVMITTSSAVYRAYYMPGTVLGVLHILSPLILTTTICDRALIISVLQVRKLRHIEIKLLNCISKWWRLSTISWVSGPKTVTIILAKNWSSATAMSLVPFLRYSPLNS